MAQQTTLPATHHTVLLDVHVTCYQHGMPHIGLHVPSLSAATRTIGCACTHAGTLYQDAISATHNLDDTFYTDFHNWGIDWKPDAYIRW